ncbi:LexA family transcriptional regulator [Desulfovibrio subterraneus]|uniref:Transcriptional regulator n=1 Tax=Desulfovibrio subterraneus TaxID=2718620 RepID=A0A7J0BL12_9BACT|nr:S24 family peptidase [Desulfovibrio subterraneus]GFM33902.1 transcriptional regulator [Desulfovibrio subterraneus]
MAQLDFHTFFRRLEKATSIKSQQDLATALGVNRSAITQAKRRDAVPSKWILALSRQFGLNPDWLEFGKGMPQRAKADAAATASPAHATHSEHEQVASIPAIATVPKVYARLCAGGGSFDVEAAVVEEHIFRQDWLARKGKPGSMVLMDVFGNSMEPEIREGDMVLVDQSQKDIFAGSIYAVGLEETVMVKRLERKMGEVVLHSDNPDYSPIQVRGDELESFRVIGRIVWISREYR